MVRPGRRPLVLTTDAFVEGVHFRRDWAPPRVLGARAFLANASDVAAMGGMPAFALVALEAPPRTPVAWLDALVAGVTAAARRAGATIVGGNVTAGPHVALTIALVGTAPGRVVARAGAKPGDDVWVTGALGASGAAVRALRRGTRGRLPIPPLRVAAGVLLARHAHAMIDVSDGLVQDVGHVCAASRVGAELELARVPVAPACRRALGAAASRFAATAGEDYELVVIAPPGARAALGRLAPRLGCRLTRSGHIVRGRDVVLVDARGIRLRSGRARGFDHFR